MTTAGQPGEAKMEPEEVARACPAFRNLCQKFLDKNDGPIVLSWSDAKEIIEFVRGLSSAPVASPLPERAWLIWSNEHRCWWRADSSGYTKHIEEAGRYTFAEAVACCDTRDKQKDGTPSELPVPAPESHAALAWQAATPALLDRIDNLEADLAAERFRANALAAAVCAPDSAAQTTVGDGYAAGVEAAAQAALDRGNFRDHTRDELTQDYGQPRFDMMNEIVEAIRALSPTDERESVERVAWSSFNASVDEDGLITLHWRGQDTGVLVMFGADGSAQVSVKSGPGDFYTKNIADFDPREGLPAAITAITAIRGRT